MTTDTVATRTVDHFVDSIGRGTGVPAELFAADAVLDATVPGWRFGVEGQQAVAAQYSDSFAVPGTFEELERLAVGDADVVTYLLTREEQGVPHAAPTATSSASTPAGGSRGTGSSAAAGGTLLCSPRWPPRSMLVDMHTAAPSVDDLLAGAQDRRPFTNPDGRSSADFEHVRIDGVAHVVKYVHLDHDFTMRVSGDIRCRTVRAWEAGLLDCAHDFVDHAIVGAAQGWGRNGWGAALLMRDVSAELLPQRDVTIPAQQHALFVDHLAGFCAATWGWQDRPGTGPGLLPYDARWEWFGPAALEGERALGWPERVPKVADEGWRRFDERAPADVVGIIEALRPDVTPLTAALRRTPSCFLHGDVKASNTGRAADGRALLIDWAYVGEGPACHELAWHLALDRSRLPVSKEATADAFRVALERHGVDTSTWWDVQLRLCLLGALVQFGWEKALGDDDELMWWCDAAREGAAWL